MSRSPEAPTIALKTGTSQDVTFEVDDMYGNGQAGYVVTGTSDVAGADTVVEVTGADGTATLALPDLSTSTVDTVAWTFVVTDASTGIEIEGSATDLNLTLVYSESGDVTLSDMTFDDTDVADFTDTPLVPYEGALSDPGDLDPFPAVKVCVTSDVPGAAVTFTGSEGVWFAKCSTLHTTPITDLGTGVADKVLKTSATKYATEDGKAEMCATSTKTGDVTVTATSSSGDAKRGTITFTNESDAARDITLTANPTVQTIGSASQLTVTVKDVFGNPVVLGGGAAQVTLATDVGTFGGLTNVAAITATDASGIARVTLLSAVAGISSVTALATDGQFGEKADDPFTGAAASVYQAATTVNWSTRPTAKTIVITGERATVKGKAGIRVDGLTSGFTTGDTVKPFVKFPGQTSYTEGSARPAIDADGEFTWQRKTGKKVYVYFTSNDGGVRSERIIIPAA